MVFRASEFDRATLPERIQRAKDLDSRNVILKNCIGAACFLAGILSDERFVHPVTEIEELIQYLEIIDTYLPTAYSVPTDATVVGLRSGNNAHFYHMALIDPDNRINVIERRQVGAELLTYSIQSMLASFSSVKSTEIVFLKNRKVEIPIHGKTDKIFRRQ